jgi:hypothetical protein
MKKAFWFLPYAILLLVVGCAALGIAAPQTFNEKLAVGYASVTSVRQAATTLVGSGKLTPDDAQNVQTQADTARAALDIARQTQTSDPSGAATKLDSTITVLTALQTYLATKGK